jgi:hypothetical protein
MGLLDFKIPSPEDFLGGFFRTYPQEREDGYSGTYMWAGPPELDITTPTPPVPDTRSSNRPADNLLHQRGYIAFNYAHDAGTQDSNPVTRLLPFFENPVITESRQANYVSNKIYLRNDTVRLYTYTKPRKINLQMTYTLPHVVEFLRGDVENIVRRQAESLGGETGSFDTQMQSVSKYLDKIVAWDVHQEDSVTRIADPRVTLPTAVFTGGREEGPGQNTFGGTASDRTVNFKYHGAAYMPTGNFHKIMDFLHYAVNHIRSSVVNSGNERTSGPPIALLKFGSLYNNVPCIVKQYKISIDEAAGYENRTLFPNRIKIDLSLEEMRSTHGTLHGDSKVTELLPGWDSILNLGHIDPA